MVNSRTCVKFINDDRVNKGDGYLSREISSSSCDGGSLVAGLRLRIGVRASEMSIGFENWNSHTSSLPLSCGCRNANSNAF